MGHKYLVHLDGIKVGFLFYMFIHKMELLVIRYSRALSMPTGSHKFDLFVIQRHPNMNPFKTINRAFGGEIRHQYTAVDSTYIYGAELGLVN